MKAKKVNKIDLVRNLLEANPRINTTQVMEKLKTSKTYTYVLMSKARKLIKESNLIYRISVGTPQAAYAKEHGIPLEDYALPEADPVNHPAHYTAGGIETIDFIEAKRLGYNLGNVVKYITRSDHKGNKLEDLRKAQWYLSREIATLK